VARASRTTYTVDGQDNFHQGPRTLDPPPAHFSPNYFGCISLHGWARDPSADTKLVWANLEPVRSFAVLTSGGREVFEKSHKSVRRSDYARSGCLSLVYMWLVR
jgi:hypothetical protein